MVRKLPEIINQPAKKIHVRLSPVPITLFSRHHEPDGTIFKFMAPCPGNINTAMFFAEGQKEPLELKIDIHDVARGFNFKLPVKPGLNTIRDCGHVETGDIITISILSSTEEQLSPITGYALALLLDPDISATKVKNFLQSEVLSITDETESLPSEETDTKTETKT